MIQLKITKTYIRILIDIVFGFRSYKENIYVLYGSISNNPRKLNIDYLINRTIFPKNYIELKYNIVFEKEQNHEKTMEIIKEALLIEERIVSKKKLLEIEQNITIDYLSLS